VDASDVALVLGTLSEGTQANAAEPSNEPVDDLVCGHLK